MNRMEEVAAMFGKRLGERFTIQDVNKNRYGAIFGEGGLAVCGAENPFVDLDSFFLEGLLTGSYEIVEDKG